MSDFPPAEPLPMVPRVEELRAYLQAYAKTFDLAPSIRLKTRVRRVEPDDGHWRVVTGDGGDARFNGVVVANGRFNRPHRPPIEGLEVFEGEVVHSFSYYGRDTFRGKRVGVLGNSLSGMEIALPSWERRSKPSSDWQSRQGLRPRPGHECRPTNTL